MLKLALEIIYVRVWKIIIITLIDIISLHYFLFCCRIVLTSPRETNKEYHLVFYLQIFYLLIYIRIITYEFLFIGKFNITYINFIHILHTNLLHMNFIYRFITYGSKSVYNYIRI